MALLQEMKDVGLTPTVGTYSALISTLSKDRWLDEALHVLEEMEDRNVVADLKVYGALMSACFYCRDKQNAMAVVCAMKEAGEPQPEPEPEPEP